MNMVTSDFGIYGYGFFPWFYWRVLQSRLLPRFLRNLFSYYFSSSASGPYDITCKGSRFRLYPTYNRSDGYILRRGKFPEHRELKFLRSHIFSGMVFVDIGANIGYYSIFASSRASHDLTLLSFEPHPETYAKLLYNLELNGAPTQNVLNCGLGDEVGELDLWSEVTNAGGNSFIKPSTSTSSHKVSVFPLLDVCLERGIEKIDILKIDIEGYEDRVLKHFFAHAPSSLLPKILVIETAHSSDWQVDLLELFASSGYVPIYATKMNTIFRR